jgi:O-antigen/teichoic acid export membrane protein
MLSKINDLGFTYVQQKFIPTSTSKTESNRLFSLAIQAKIIFGLIILIIGILLTPFLTRLIDLDNTTIIYLAFVVSLATVGFEQLSAMLQSLLRFPQAVTTNALQAGMKFVVALFLWLVGVYHSSLYFIGYMLSPLFPVIFSSVLLPSSVNVKLKANYRPELKRYSKLASHSMVAFIAAGIIENIDILIVQGMLNEYQTGLFGGVGRIAMMFSMIAFSLATVLNPRVARYTQKVHMDAYLKKVLLLSLLSVVSLGFLIWTSQLLILVTIGSEYLAAQGSLNILLVASMSLVITVALMATFFAFPKAEWYFSSAGLLQLTVLIAVNIWLVPKMGIEGASYARLISRGLLFVYTLVVFLIMYRRTYAQVSYSNNA